MYTSSQALKMLCFPPRGLVQAEVAAPLAQSDQGVTLGAWGLVGGTILLVLIAVDARRGFPWLGRALACLRAPVAQLRRVRQERRRKRLRREQIDQLEAEIQSFYRRQDQLNKRPEND